MATRTCDKGGDWNDAVYDKCLTLTTFLLCNLTEVCLHALQAIAIIIMVRIQE